MVSELVGADCYGLAGMRVDAPKRSVVVDAGANIGVASLLLATRFDRRVLALEPIPDNRDALTANLEINNERRVEILACGLAGTDRSDRLWQDPSQSVSAHFNDIVTEDRPAGLRFFDADFVSLPTLLSRVGAEEVALLKLDIEGGEHEVLASLDASMARRIHAISLEAHDLGAGSNVKTLGKRLRGLGYLVTIRPHIGAGHGLHYISAHRPNA